ncbi:MAG TPA: glycosyltransferase family 39 protein [Thermoanaerobaculia bacterium]|jgi:4-amino-4-deoxy-L-arabinose transferase-like glycosyltransferase
MRAKALAAVAILSLLATLRIASTHRVFSQTIDEAIHVAAGFEWLAEGRYSLDVEHPPLPRALFALDAWLSGATVTGTADRTERGNELLYRDGAYRRNLAAARAGNLPWFLLGAVAVYLWAARLGGRAAGVVAVALFGSLPPILAHAGLATTDMAAAATLAAALYALARWLDEPAWGRTAVLGLAIGAGFLAKFSFLLFFALGAFILCLPRLPRPAHLGRLAAAALMGFLLVCAAYRFESAPLDAIRLGGKPPGTAERTAWEYRKVPGYGWVAPGDIEAFREYARRSGKPFVDFCDWAKAAGHPSPLAGRYGNTLAGAPPVPRATRSPLREVTHWLTGRVPIPAITFFAGADYVRRHTASGHPGYLFGETRMLGWWYYFPVVVFFKTPLPFLLLAIAGLAILIRRREVLGLVPIALLAVSMTSRINIGVRHILPLYPLLTVAAAVAVVALWPRRRLLVGLLLGWYFVATALAHPDYLSYFNEAAGRHPERIAADSNLDWGQDLLRLEEYAERQQLKPLYISYWGWTRVREHLPESLDLPHGQCVAGWVAISEMHPILNRDHAFDWLRAHRPVKKIGASIRLYFIPEGACGPTLDPPGQH